jgi:proteic killer suppression protein
MIASIRHKGLKRLYEDGDPRSVIAEHVGKLRDILGRLDAARVVADMDMPEFRLHPLKGEFKGFWTERRSNHADEESPSPWRFCSPVVH